MYVQYSQWWHFQLGGKSRIFTIIVANTSYLHHTLRTFWCIESPHPLSPTQGVLLFVKSPRDDANDHNINNNKIPRTRYYLGGQSATYIIPWSHHTMGKLLTTTMR